MSECVKTLMSLKQAANYSKLAMRDMGPRSYKRGQGALLKVIYRFGENHTLAKDEAKKILNWRGKQLREVAKKASKNGYITIANPEDGFAMSLTELGTEVIEKRLAAEDKAAEAVLSGLSDSEQETLLQLTQKVSETCKELGIDYSAIRKHPSKDCCKEGRKHEHCHSHSHSHSHGHGPQNVFVFKGEGGCSKHHGHRC